jgi:hypothetical protein
MDKFDAQLVLYKGMFTGETSLKCKRNWTPSRTSFKKTNDKSITYFRRMEKCTSSEFKELIQSVSAERSYL